MKKVTLLLIVALVAGSCTLFENPSMTQEEIDTMVAQNVDLQEQLVQAQHEAGVQKLQAQECANVLAELQGAEAEVAAGKYIVVVGSFKNQAFADEYAVKTKALGGQGNIIPGPSDFKLVSLSSHAKLGEAVNAMEDARNNANPEAWVYMKK